MKVNSRFIILFLFLKFIPEHYCQKETQNWYFGFGAGITFSTTPPSPLANSTMSVHEGCASISDSNGDLLFYTDGSTIFNKFHQIMPNGSNLINNVSTSAQSSIIVKNPLSNSLYYAFSLEDFCCSYTGKLQLSVINMALAAGTGSVISKNVVLSDSCVEKMTGTKHCNGIDTWVLVYSEASDQFRAFKVGPGGVTSVPQVSNSGCWCLNDHQGCMKISPNGKKLCVTRAYSGSQWGICLFDFDSSTGLVSNPNFINTYGEWGCEFSPDGSKLYFSKTNYLLQLDLCAGNNSLIAASVTTVGTNTVINYVTYGGMQLALDGKIYINDIADVQALGVINNPNGNGIACNFVANAIPLAPNKHAQWGLPNYINSVFKPLPGPITYTPSGFSCTQFSFTAPPIQTVTPNCDALSEPYIGFSWIFGDPNSGNANFSNQPNPIHSFSSTGLFKVKIVLYTNCGSDTIYESIKVGCAELIQSPELHEQKLQFYPNPAGREIFLISEHLDEFEIMDYVGNNVIKGILVIGEQTISIDSLKEGIYFVSFKNQKKTFKFIKQK